MWAAALAWIWQRLAHFLIYFVLGALLIWLIFGAMLKPVLWPNPTHTQTGGTAYNYEIKVGFGGCARLPVVKNVEPAKK